MKHVGVVLVLAHEKSSRVSGIWLSMQQRACISIIKTRFVALLAFLVLLLFGSWLVLPAQAVAYAADQAKEQSSRGQVVSILQQAAATYGLPANLLLAIAWQESGWRQDVVSHDGAIGVMQLMPQTVKGLNAQVRAHYNPYKLADNITLGAIYLRSLWKGFHGDLNKVISAYNQGGWSVVHHGILNWRYVNNVRALMRKF